VIDYATWHALLAEKLPHQQGESALYILTYLGPTRSANELGLSEQVFSSE
jgi:hypothetical protein